jgi:hypothetical protein
MLVGRRAEELAQPGRRGILERRRYRARMVWLGANNSASSKKVILNSRKLHANRLMIQASLGTPPAYLPIALALPDFPRQQRAVVVAHAFDGKEKTWRDLLECCLYHREGHSIFDRIPLGRFRLNLAAALQPQGDEPTK